MPTHKEQIFHIYHQRATELCEYVGAIHAATIEVAQQKLYDRLCEQSENDISFKPRVVPANKNKVVIELLVGSIILIDPRAEEAERQLMKELQRSYSEA